MLTGLWTLYWTTHIYNLHDNGAFGFHFIVCDLVSFFACYVTFSALWAWAIFFVWFFCTCCLLLLAWCYFYHLGHAMLQMIFSLGWRSDSCISLFYLYCLFQKIWTISDPLVIFRYISYNPWVFHINTVLAITIISIFTEMMWLLKMKLSDIISTIFAWSIQASM